MTTAPEEQALFDLTDQQQADYEAAQRALEAAEAEAALSAGRRLTLRQKRDVEAGRHPLADGATYPDRGTCGDCRFRRLEEYHNRTYPKCAAPGVRNASSVATDVRAWWPACSKWEAKP